MEEKNIFILSVFVLHYSPVLMSKITHLIKVLMKLTTPASTTKLNHTTI